MSTRGFVGFVVDGTEKIFITHGDSYPSGIGVTVLRWLNANRDSLDQVRALRVLARPEQPSPADLERIRELLHGRRKYPRNFIDGASPEELLEFATYDLSTLMQAGVIVDGSFFPQDSLMCEWGYLVDLDTATFEVYRGFQREPHTAGRFAQRPSRDGRYHPVALVASWPLAQLPDERGFRDTF